VSIDEGGRREGGREGGRREGGREGGREEGRDLGMVLRNFLLLLLGFELLFSRLF
jgi:hypothetical protein